MVFLRCSLDSTGGGRQEKGGKEEAPCGPEHCRDAANGIHLFEDGSSTDNACEMMMELLFFAILSLRVSSCMHARMCICDSHRGFVDLHSLIFAFPILACMHPCSCECVLETSQTAERLYISGFISYPRTESTKYPDSFDFVAVLEEQTRDDAWGEYVIGLLEQVLSLLFCISVAAGRVWVETTP